MPKKPNYDFERRERERMKREKVAARAAGKAKPVDSEDSSDDGEPDATSGHE